jgi:hypothetical protein
VGGSVWSPARLHHFPAQRPGADRDGYGMGTCPGEQAIRLGTERAELPEFAENVEWRFARSDLDRGAMRQRPEGVVAFRVRRPLADMQGPNGLGSVHAGICARGRGRAGP